MSNEERRRSDGPTTGQWLFIHYFIALGAIYLITEDLSESIGWVGLFHALCALIAAWTHRRDSSAAIAEAAREARMAMEAIRERIEKDGKGP